MISKEILENLIKKAKSTNKAQFLKIYENEKGIALLMIFPDGNIRIRVASKLQFNKQYINFREEKEISQIREILEKLEEEKNILNLLKSSEP
jgi:transcriptional regulator of heat shock response